ncbi:uncharacterized protein LOC113342147 [Papaver somniferum]|uniref:uncharacterized protein LOC113342147 n=1 Tax=Papaver somniferum TaxID=3469 RepID=UPI000E704542|nr:uncharacterized protein LOC113342147 [Papaver somniferum]
MRHTRYGSYCLRKNKITKRDECRFRFSIELLDESKLVEEPSETNIYRFVGRRNDELLNSHNRAVLQTWRANIDCSAVTTMESVIRYIAKYAAKCEPASRDFIDTLRGIIDDPLRPCRDSRSAIKRLLIKNVSERDVSAQENRSNDDGEQGITDPNFFSRYLTRPDNYEQMTLIEMAKTRYYAHRKLCKHRVEAVVRILPVFSTKNIMPDTDHWESYCKQQVLLNSRYRSIEEAKRNFDTWSDCYSELIRPTENPSVDLGMVEDELEEEMHPEDEPRDEWMVAAAMAPNSRVLEDTDLGMRDIDLNYKWSQGLQDHPSIHEKKGFINTLRKTVQETHSVSGSGTSLIALSRQQQVAHDIVLESLSSKSTIRLIINGGAGTGKSTHINVIVH